MDRHDLDRFVAAQRDTFDTALAELAAGTKRSHWMWYIFPQIAGLGHSAMAQRYAIADPDEARAYLAHAVLGQRYLTCVTTLLFHHGRSAASIMGEVDALKLRSSLTLFDLAGGPAPIREALNHFFDSPDPATLRMTGG